MFNVVYLKVKFNHKLELMAINPKELEFNKNDDTMRMRISEMERKLETIYLGGGKSKIEKHHEKGKLTARERIDLLID